MIRTLFATALISSSLLAGVALADQTPPPPPQAGSAPQAGEHHGWGPRGPQGKEGPGREGFRGEHGPRGGLMLAGLDLTDAQRDQIWKLHYAAEPTAHTQFETLRKTHKALRDLLQSNDYSDAKAQQLVQQQAQAQATLELNRIKTQRAVLALLTPEQKQKLQERMKDRAEHGPEHGGPGGWDKRADNDGPRGPQGPQDLPNDD
ncbi:Spy/CpxP family protein refolding chaperone [Amantichitinum ursilacus]|nr:Spy/CpxP family protein refolding chaperone [Amantichitinum ursilacus]